MTASRNVTIWCDGNSCQAWTDGASRTATDARRVARREGWSRHGKDDLRPWHTEHGSDAEFPSGDALPTGGVTIRHDG